MNEDKPNDGGEMSSASVDDDSHKDGFEMHQKLVAYLVHQAGGEVVINQRDFLSFNNHLTLESQLDVLTGVVTISARYV